MKHLYPSLLKLPVKLTNTTVTKTVDSYVSTALRVFLARGGLLSV